MLAEMSDEAATRLGYFVWGLAFAYLLLVAFLLDIWLETRKIRKLLERRPPPVDPETFR